MTARRLYESGFAGRGDDVYDALLEAHSGLNDEESHALNARLVLLLANRIGDVDDVRELIETARSYAAG